MRQAAALASGMRTDRRNMTTLLPRKMKIAARRVGERLGVITPYRDTGAEKNSNYYDSLYAQSQEYGLDYPQSRYYFMWSVIVDRIRRDGIDDVLEIGCGSGQLARFLVDQGVERYTGLDFSVQAIEMGARRVPEGKFVVDDARTSEIYDRCTYEAVVCTEVL